MYNTAVTLSKPLIFSMTVLCFAYYGAITGIAADLIRNLHYEGRPKDAYRCLWLYILAIVGPNILPVIIYVALKFKIH